MPEILIVEDEANMRQGLRDNLVFEGYAVDLAADGDEGLRRMTDHAYDLIILDVMLPRRSGFEVCQEARRQGVSTPIIMLTARSEEVDKVLGLEFGADDYVTKPFSLRELLARIKAVLRRQQTAPTPAARLRLGRLDVDFGSYEATAGGEPVAMTHLEFEVLRYLHEHAQQSVSREQLLSDVWGYDAQPTTRTVDNFILKLRQKIEPDPAQPRHILTVHGVGYKLIP